MKFLHLIPLALLFVGCAAMNRPISPEVIDVAKATASGLGEFLSEFGLTPAGLTPMALGMFVLNKIRNMTSPERVKDGMTT